ncbi:Las1-domain-containing protein [Dendrothele bispora CBS 962.96]|uniref:Las1-domain-containing protein n=1 Tax=Dendrothele bispora (strain CBS 962.96) TaxID=1314807 RepID=A0A4S8MSY5_DENBC|nr:Las1-domain-containing protein [Dendrothele bispora CBS 962.96]
MRLPRRVPWASLAELDQVCAAIFTDENDLESKIFAINRLSAWRAITSLPHALESTLALLVVIVQDSQSPRNLPFLSLRQSYASAIIRLVNGLVDPLQFGVYARSIASIASQLGLPSWLVELRHAATHEDLPSLELLREGARQSMSWLLHNYWLPTLNPFTASHSKNVTLRPVEPILKQYKSLFKTVTRDISLRKKYKQEIAMVMKDVEKWIAEAKVAADVVAGELGWNTTHMIENGEGSDQDAKERWALEVFSDALLEKGGLIPLSKKKRVFPSDSFSPPKSSVEIWSSLLTHVENLHPEFASILVNRMLIRLLNKSPITKSEKSPEPSNNDSTYYVGIARWLNWVIDILAIESNEMQDVELKLDTVAALIMALEPGSEQITRETINDLLQSLCKGDSSLENALSALQPPNKIVSANWTPDDISMMNERLGLLSSTQFAEEEPANDVVSTESTSQSQNSAPGWRLLDSSSEWRPCPIGVHCASVQ